MTRHIGYGYGAKLEPFSSPCLCCSGAALQEYTSYYQKGYRRMTGKPSYYTPAEVAEAGKEARR